MVELHEAISHHFRDDRSARNHVAALISVRHCPAGRGESGCLIAIDEDEVKLFAQIAHRKLHRRQRGDKNIAPVDLFGADDADADRGMLHNDIEGSATRGRSEALRIIDAHWKRGFLKPDGSSNDGSGPGAAARFIDAGDAAESRRSGVVLRG